MPDVSEPDDLDLVQSAPRRLVLITGAGRSGTSTLSGTLNFLGLHSPRPSLGANASNPRGFFEPRWAIDFHRRILDRALVDIFDSRPDAIERIRAVLTPEHEGEVVEWLSQEVAHAPQVVVKDPRSTWMPLLWESAASRLDMPTSFVTMLRHPAEVIGSRSTYYAKGDERSVRQFQVTSIARWVNANLLAERQTRGESRAFVPYSELLENWRPVLLRLKAELNLTYNADVASDAHHSVDDFVDPSLRRHHVGWGDLDIPAHLQETAEETWHLCTQLASSHGRDAAVEAGLDELATKYGVMLGDAAAIAHDVTAAEVKLARRKAVRKVRAAAQSATNDSSPAQDKARFPLRLIAGWTRSGR